MIVKVEIIHDNPQQESTFIAFKGDELTSPEQQAILFLKEQDKKNEVL